MWIPKGAALIKGQLLLEARRLLKEIRYCKKTSAKTKTIFFFLIAVAHFRQKLFFMISFQVSHNPSTA